MKVLYATALILMSFHVSATPKSHVSDFVSIFKQYCFSFKDNPKGATNFLESRGLRRNPEFQDAYEIVIGDVDYAVTPQVMDCTADVLIKSRTRKLFSRTEISNRLKSIFGLSEVGTQYFQDIALNNKDTKIQQTDYTGRGGYKYRLLYPMNNQDSYYMTFTIDW
jgi:hypothetical protein